MRKKQKQEFDQWIAMLKDSAIDYNPLKSKAWHNKGQILKVMPLWKLERKPKKKKK